MSRETTLYSLRSLNEEHAAGNNSRHKRLLVLLALAEWLRCKAVVFPFVDIEERLTSLIGEFGRTEGSERINPLYPFWHLQADGVWRVETPSGAPVQFDPKREKKRPYVTELRTQQARGRFVQSIESDIQEITGLAEEAINCILSDHFEAHEHPTLKKRLCLPLS